ncbi:NADPH-dependent F420 reductase [Nocardia pseudobrasiliensis]|uniref:Pyrroline-5-carboxylate reductase catalytic N-terminal domain-containing protein n=1 Tax=Nocardia pseudobrasiliensis TaxID=45979 RepID=A0A370IA01_9NOCA|nr:NAD(P)-binding domain-containing protein [Nocardia pseudobrasiliensis]RDI66951.1 hypothetical protein DFR76_10322 [Nocardia pseudobrasiliensis]
MNLTLGLIGSGQIGSALARLAVDAGVNVVLSNSRGPGSLAEKVAELGERVRAATPVEAARSDIVVATIPLKGYTALPAAALAGKTVIDTMNYYPDREGHIAELDTRELTSSALVQRYLAGSRVVKAFNTIDSHRLVTLARPSGAADRSALPIAGDHAAAKAQAAHLLDLLGYDAVDIGTLAESWRSEPQTPLYQPYLPEPPEGMSYEQAQRWFLETPGVPVPASRVEELAAAAVRGPVGGVTPTWVPASQG